MWGPSWGNFLIFLGCLFQDRFLIVLGSVLESIWGPFWQYNRNQIEEKTRLILGSIFNASLGKNEKNESKNYPLFPGRGGPGGPFIRSKDFLNKKQLSEQETRKGNLNKKKAQLFLSLFRLLLTFAYHCSDYC